MHAAYNILSGYKRILLNQGFVNDMDILPDIEIQQCFSLSKKFMLSHVCLHNRTHIIYLTRE